MKTVTLNAMLFTLISIVRTLGADQALAADFSVPLFENTKAKTESTLELTDKLHSKPLIGHRLEYDTNNPLLLSAFEDYRLYISLELTTYYDQKKQPKPAYRIRWFSNTHVYTDEAIVDANDFTLLRQQALGGNYKAFASRTIHFGEEKIDAVTAFSDAPPDHKQTENKGNYYHLVVLPYLFTALELDLDETIFLPTYSPTSNEISNFDVTFLGVESQEVKGKSIRLHKYRSNHSWVEITWYIDKLTPPYLHKTEWRYKSGPLADSTGIQETINWIVFPDDTNSNVVR